MKGFKRVGGFLKEQKQGVACRDFSCCLRVGEIRVTNFVLDKKRKNYKLWLKWGFKQGKPVILVARFGLIHQFNQFAFQLKFASLVLTCNSARGMAG